MLNKAIKIICSEYNISEQILPTSARDGNVSECRAMICYVLLWKLRIPEDEVAKLLNRTPKNCLYLLERARGRIDMYASENRKFDRIMEEINANTNS